MENQLHTLEPSPAPAGTRGRPARATTVQYRVTDHSALAPRSHLTMVPTYDLLFAEARRLDLEVVLEVVVPEGWTPKNFHRAVYTELKKRARGEVIFGYQLDRENRRLHICRLGWDDILPDTDADSLADALG